MSVCVHQDECIALIPVTMIHCVTPMMMPTNNSGTDNTRAELSRHFDKSVLQGQALPYP